MSVLIDPFLAPSVAQPLLNEAGVYVFPDRVIAPEGTYFTAAIDGVEVGAAPPDWLAQIRNILGGIAAALFFYLLIGQWGAIGAIAGSAIERLFAGLRNKTQLRIVVGGSRIVLASPDAGQAKRIASVIYDAARAAR